MKSIMTLIVVLIVVSIIGTVFYAGFLSIGYIWQLFAELESTLRLVLLSSLAVFMVGCFIVAGAIKKSAQTQLKIELMESKIELYKSLCALYERYFSSNDSAINNQQDMLESLDAIKTEFNLIADSSVIEVYRKLESALMKTVEYNEQLALYQQLIIKMRKDLGHGTHIDESRLKFLVSINKDGKADSEGHGVSA